MKSGTANINDIRANKLRFDCSFHLSDAQRIRKVFENLPYKCLTVGKVASRIFNGGRYRRVYVDNPEHGYKFLSSSDILSADLENVKLVSRKYMGGIDELGLQKGWTLITRSGTIGKCAFANAKHAQKLASEDVIRLVPNNILREGVIYAFLASRYGYALLTQGTFGAVIQHIEPDFVASLPIPEFPKDFQEKIDGMIQESARLREEAQTMLTRADKELKSKAGLRDLNTEDYNYYGAHPSNREVSVFSVRRSSKDVITIHAFNHSERMKKTLSMLDNISTIRIGDAISEDGWVSPGGVKVVDLSEGTGIMLINQSDIFDNIIKGKWVPKKDKYEKDLLHYGDILIAKIGTLGENETFCRCVFANEDLEGQLTSSAFYKLKSSGVVPSGYLYCWLSSDWGFRQLRSSQYGTKQCYPNPKLLNEYRMPILSQEEMEQIDQLVRNAFTSRHKANKLELRAIEIIESEIEKWSK